MAGEGTTYGELVARTRKTLNDVEHGTGRAVRWSDQMILDGLRDGISALEKLRPAARYQGMRLADRKLSPLSTDPVLLDSHFHECICEYAAYKMLQMDENDAGPAYRSNMHHKRFEELARS